MKKLLSLCLLISLCALADFMLEVQNTEVERFEYVVSCELPLQQVVEKSYPIVREIDSQGKTGTPVPSVIDTTGSRPVLCWLLTGITDANAVRNYTVSWTQEAPEAANTDLKCKVKDGKILLATSYFELNHPCKGQGGFPKDIRYRFSGFEDTGIMFYDRLFDSKTHHQYMVSHDQNARAEVIFQSPLRVIVKSTARYCMGMSYSQDNMSVVYYYTYTANSPVIDVRSTVTRGDGTPVSWSEVHFLHLSRSELYYNQLITCEPVEIHEMQPKQTKSKGYGASQWAVFDSGIEAMGVGGGIINCWDASSEYVYYINRLRTTMPPEVKTLSHEGKLYFGPSFEDKASYGQWLGDSHNPKVRIKDAPNVVTQREIVRKALISSDFQLDNDQMRLVFSDASQGFACLGLIDKASNVQFFNQHDNAPGLWRLYFRKPGSTSSLTVTNQSSQNATCEVSSDRLRFFWKGLDINEDKGVLDVMCTVVYNKAAQCFEFTISVDNRSKLYGLWETDYPCLSQVFEPGQGDALLPGGNWGGRLIKHSSSSCVSRYPSTSAPMQFMAFNIGNTGLYFAAHDGGSRPKTLKVSSAQDISFCTSAENMGQPGAHTAAPFPVVVRTYHGDWWQAAKLYRSWALQQVWTSKGPIAQRKDYPQRFIDNGFWTIIGGAPANVEKNMEQVARRVHGRVPFGNHWYNWHQIPFDHSYPEYFPTKEGFAETTRRLVGQGQMVMPYINGRLWDLDIESFTRQGHLSACKDINGKPYIEIYASKRKLVPNCPYTKLWQDKVNEICNRLMDECGVNGIYLDQIGAARAVLCYDPTHGHPLGGGTYWCDGYRTLLTPIKAKAAAQGVTLTTENTAEPYMDNIDGYLTWIQRNQEDVPALPAVYSGYTIYFTSPQVPSDDFNAFRACQGRDFLWGCQLGWNAEWLLNEQHKDHFEYLVRLGCLQKAAKDFMVLGELKCEVPNDTPAAPFTTTWRLRSPHAVTLPSVQSTLWTNQQGEYLLAIVNYSNEPQRFSNLKMTLPVNGLHEIYRLNEHGEATLGFTDDQFHVDLTLRSQEVCLLTCRNATHKAKELRKLLKKSFKTVQDAELKDSVAEKLLQLASQVKIDMPSLNLKAIRGEQLKLSCKVSGIPASKKIQMVLPDGKTYILDGKQQDFSANITCWNEAGDLAIMQKYIEITMPGEDGYQRIPVSIVPHNKLSVKLGTLPNVRGGDKFSMPVSVVNHSRYPQRARILLSAPAGWRFEPSSVWDSGEIPSGGMAATLMKVTVPTQAATGKANITASILQDSVDTPISVQKARPVIQAYPYQSLRVQVKKLGFENKDGIHIEKDYGGDADCSGEVSCAWNNEYLYIAALVRDNIHHQTNLSPQVWEGDCVQFAIAKGPMNKLSCYNGQEVEFALAYSEKDGPFVYLWEAAGIGDLMKTAKIKASRHVGITSYEAQIPWKELGLPAPTAGQRIPFTFTINDNDGNGFRGWLEWTPGLCGKKNSSAFGWLTLEKGINP